MASLLLVDDDVTFCQVLAPPLTRRGFEVTVAHSVDEAELAINNFAPEYAVVDLHMPGPSGLTLVRHLRQMGVNTRILILTGYASVFTATEAIHLGASNYLAKPADADEIVAALQQDRGRILTGRHGIPTSSKQ